MSYDIGLNLRATAGFVTDPANTTYCLGEAYPVTRSLVTSGLSVTFGFDSDCTGNARDRDSGVAAACAGVVKRNSLAEGDATLRIDLPASGACQVYLAAGDQIYGNGAAWQLIDSDGTTVLASKTLVTLTAGQHCDASGIVRTSAADWVTNNAPVSVTFSGAIAYLKIVSSDPETSISHIRLYQSGGGATSDPAASSSRFNKSRHTFGTRR